MSRIEIKCTISHGFGWSLALWIRIRIQESKKAQTRINLTGWNIYFFRHSKIYTQMRGRIPGPTLLYVTPEKVSASNQLLVSIFILLWRSRFAFWDQKSIKITYLKKRKHYNFKYKYIKKSSYFFEFWTDPYQNETDPQHWNLNVQLMPSFRTPWCRCTTRICWRGSWLTRLTVSPSGVTTSGRTTRSSPSSGTGSLR